MLVTQQYPFTQLVAAAGKKWPDGADEMMALARQAGYDAWEPAFMQVEEVAPFAALATKHGLAVPSFYTGGIFHDEQNVEGETERVVRLAEQVRPLGATICVINPNPIRWGGPENKTDPQLIVQAEALERLGRRLKQGPGVTLAYHTHSPEMRCGARELHHMLAGTDPSMVKFCLDTHWIFRGTENSAVAMFDVLALYADRIVELHLRQSRGGTWTESFDPAGDIDYAQVARRLRERNLQPLLVLEQATEKDTPVTLSPLERNQRSVGFLRSVFG